MLLTSYCREVKLLGIVSSCGGLPSEKTIVDLFLTRPFSG